MGNEDPVSSVASPKNMDDVGGPGKAILPALNGVAYPVPPDQPMLTDRYSQRRDTEPKNAMPASLQQSPEREDIILFAPMQTSQDKNKLFVQS